MELNLNVRSFDFFFFYFNEPTNNKKKLFLYR